MKISGLILAAGNSSRLGQPKQLLTHKGTTLLRHIEQQLMTACDELLVVLGHDQQRMRTQLQQARVVINNNWHKGMGHSLKLGFKELHHHSDAILVALCDQPFIPTSHYQGLADTIRKHPDHLISSHYADRCGVPAVFSPAFFPAVLALSDQQGARNLLRQNQPNHITLPCPQAAKDIDVEAQINHLDTINTKD